MKRSISFVLSSQGLTEIFISLAGGLLTTLSFSLGRSAASSGRLVPTVLALGLNALVAGTIYSLIVSNRQGMARDCGIQVGLDEAIGVAAVITGVVLFFSHATAMKCAMTFNQEMGIEQVPFTAHKVWVMIGAGFVGLYGIPAIKDFAIGTCKIGDSLFQLMGENRADDRRLAYELASLKNGIEFSALDAEIERHSSTRNQEVMNPPTFKW